MEFNYKKALNLEERKAEFEKVLASANGKIPIIFEKDPRSKMEELGKTKFLINPDMNVTQFEGLIRKRVKLDKECALFFIVNGKHAIVGTQLFSEIYQKFKDEDGFLYIAYSNEQVWG
jgi:GABA(A) receptor-associated protein